MYLALEALEARRSDRCVSAHPKPTGRAAEGEFGEYERQTGRMPQWFGSASRGTGTASWSSMALISLGACCSSRCCFAPRNRAARRAARSATIRVAGNRRVEPETVRSYLNSTSATPTIPARSTSPSRRCSPPACSPTCASTASGAGVLVTVVENPVINQVAFEGNREVDNDTLRERGAAQAALGVHPRPRAGRRAAHPRRLPPAGPLCRLRRAQDHRARQQPREPRVRDQRGRATKVKAINFIGNHAFSDSQLRDIISTTQSGCSTSSRAPTSTTPTAWPRSRAAAPVLPEERLRRRARRRGRRRARSRRLGLLRHLRRSTRASSTNSAPSTSRVGAARASNADALRSELLTEAGRHLRPVADGQDGRAADAGRVRAGLRLCPRAPARRARSRHAHDQRHLRRSTKARASTSSASTSSATCAPRTTSSGASSAWRKATPTTR